MDMQAILEQEETSRKQYEATTVVTEQGETIAFLRTIFDAVCNTTDWKRPIAVTCQHSLVGTICRAIEFFQGDHAQVSGPQELTGYLLVTSRGYQG